MHSVRQPTLLWRPVIQDNPGKAVSEWQTILDFTAARNDEGGSGDNQNVRRAKLQSDYHHYQNTDSRFL